MVEWKITVDGVIRLQPNAMVSCNLGKQLPEMGILLITLKNPFIGQSPKFEILGRDEKGCLRSTSKKSAACTFELVNINFTVDINKQKKCIFKF